MENLNLLLALAAVATSLITIIVSVVAIMNKKDDIAVTSAIIKLGKLSLKIENEIGELKDETGRVIEIIDFPSSSIRIDTKGQAQGADVIISGDMVNIAKAEGDKINIH